MLFPPSCLHTTLTTCEVRDISFPRFSATCGNWCGVRSWSLLLGQSGLRVLSCCSSHGSKVPPPPGKQQRMGRICSHEVNPSCRGSLPVSPTRSHLCECWRNTSGAASTGADFLFLPSKWYFAPLAALPVCGCCAPALLCARLLFSATDTLAPP